MNNIREMAHNLQAETIAFRRDLHKTPNLAWRSSAPPIRWPLLDAMGVSYRRLDPTGVIAEVKGANPIPTRSSPCGLTWTP